MKSMKKVCSIFCMLCIFAMCFVACGKKGLADGTYQVDVTMEGGSGRASIESPASLNVKDGKMMLTIVWSSKYYDYMIVDDVKYLNEVEDGTANSTFTFPISSLEEKLEVIGDTIAMSEPHEINYSLSFDLVD